MEPHSTSVLSVPPMRPLDPLSSSVPMTPKCLLELVVLVPMDGAVQMLCSPFLPCPSVNPEDNVPQTFLCPHCVTGAPGPHRLHQPPFCQAIFAPLSPAVPAEQRSPFCPLMKEPPAMSPRQLCPPKPPLHSPAQPPNPSLHPSTIPSVPCSACRAKIPILSLRKEPPAVSPHHPCPPPSPNSSPFSSTTPKSLLSPPNHPFCSMQCLHSKDPHSVTLSPKEGTSGRVPKAAVSPQTSSPFSITTPKSLLSPPNHPCSACRARIPILSLRKEPPAVSPHHPCPPKPPSPFPSTTPKSLLSPLNHPFCPLQCLQSKDPCSFP
ncbi:uncharacterized protein LOC125686298 isoform X2 [Lagopus muta]|uniref:uncharacterized protein LOC125686298 isoform X2 n=1 Tax=Lagopus muta TaxID=64668 RepID=UPI00209E79BB|nr:uncharacterized protein LOC125686298 isoform X2 [Lagopus muta]